MSQFFTQAYLKPQYFNMNYIHGATAVPSNDGRSGYWRLFFHNMQEEALKKDEQVEREAAQEGTRKGAAKEPAEVAKPIAKPVRQRHRAVPVRATEETTFNVVERPIYRTQAELLPENALFLNVISEEFRAMLKTSNVIQLRLKARQAELEEEENDDDMLLLAA